MHGKWANQSCKKSPTEVHSLFLHALASRLDAYAGKKQAIIIIHHAKTVVRNNALSLKKNSKA